MRLSRKQPTGTWLRKILPCLASCVPFVFAFLVIKLYDVSIYTMSIYTMVYKYFSTSEKFKLMLTQSHVAYDMSGARTTLISSQEETFWSILLLLTSLKKRQMLSLSIGIILHVG